MCYIYIKNNEIDFPIYRYISIEKLFDIFNKKHMILKRPYLWDDPLEDDLFKQWFLYINKIIPSYNTNDEFINNLYAQCWSLLEESDAMWRIYSKNKMGVKIKTTIRKLYNSLKDFQTKNNTYMNSVYIGKVKYLLREIIMKRTKNNNINNIDNKKHIKGKVHSLLYKPDAFKHEDEVRLILDLGGDKCIKNQNKYYFRIDPYDLIDEIIFDPRMNDQIFEIFKEYFEKIGFKKNIAKSDIYEDPKRTVADFMK